jgi:hypothetical protein
MGFGLVIGFIEHLKLLTTNPYSGLINLHILQIVFPSNFIVTSRYRLTNNFIL